MRPGVHPAMVPQDALLANIHDEFNAIQVQGSAVGPQVFSGRGAGRLPTASAVVADMVELVERKAAGASTSIGDMILGEDAAAVVSIEDVQMRYFMRVLVRDQPGVLAGDRAHLGRGAHQHCLGHPKGARLRGRLGAAGHCHPRGARSRNAAGAAGRGCT